MSRRMIIVAGDLSGIPRGLFESAAGDLGADLTFEGSSGTGEEIAGADCLVITGGDIPERISAVSSRSPDLPIVAVSTSPSITEAKDAIIRGAVDYLHPPFDAEVISDALSEALSSSRLEEDLSKLVERLARVENPEVVSSSASIRTCLDMISSVAFSDVPVVFIGESGVGKEVLARSLHRQGPRNDSPFVAVNCGAIPDTLFEAEIFGSRKGAFTGSVRDKPGLVEAAAGGTLFLDEIGELSLRSQVKLLHFLQSGEFRRVGENRVRRADARITAATNKDLAGEIAKGSFREDLFFRLAVVVVEVPPLRTRSEDILPLARSFIDRYGRVGTGLTPGAVDALEGYSWPGNVRELENVIRRAVAVSRDRMIDLADLPEALSKGDAGPRPETPSAGPDISVPLGEARDAFERRYIETLIEANKGNKSAAARAAGIDRKDLSRRMKRLGIQA